MKRFEVTTKIGGTTTTHEINAGTVKAAIDKATRTHDLRKLKSSETFEVSLRRVPFTKEHAAARQAEYRAIHAKYVKPEIRVGSWVMSPDGHAQVIAIHDDGTTDIKIHGSDPYVGDIILNEHGVAIGEIVERTTTDDGYRTQTKLFNPTATLAEGDTVTNLSLSLRMERQTEIGKQHAREMQQDALSDEDKQMLADIGEALPY